MIYITGDTHREWMTRLNKQSFPEQEEMTKNDYVIICGDFGIWDHSKSEEYNLDWLEERSFTTLFVDGNHSNFDILNTYSTEQWHGGNVHFIRPSVIHLMRGQVFNIENKCFFTFGGAQSHDIDAGILDRNSKDFKAKKQELDERGVSYRIAHETWWKEELPTEEEMQEGLMNLENSVKEVDFVITHCGAASTIKNRFSRPVKEDSLMTYFDIVKKKLENENYKWFMGHYHENMQLSKNEYVLYEQIIRIL